MADLTPGVYEHLRTRELDGLIAKVTDQDLLQLRKLDPADADEILARHLGRLTRRALRSVESQSRQLEIVNRVAGLIAELVPDAAGESDLVATPQELMAVADQRGWSDGKVAFPDRPTVPFTASALMMNGRGQPQIGHELIREFATADHVDLLCAFVKWNGIRLLDSTIEEFCRRGGVLRVITSTYLGATDHRAVLRLAALGAQIKVSYATKMTRLHAKAWLFRRERGLSTAYVGSSNLSRTALSHGLEWNVRLAQAEQPHLIDTFGTTFDDYWHDSVFEDFDPERDAERLRDALRRERKGETSSEFEFDHAYLDVTPYPFQEEVLDRLSAEREVHGHRESLVVMATGTGKTIVAALDYRRLRKRGSADSLLFVAHREDILRQSRQRFRHVLRDMNFGEMFVGGQRPAMDGRHVFASIQSMHSRGYKDLDPELFDMVIVDEFHHAEANTYRNLLNHLRPKFLLGLTATPERADGRDVREWFGGREPIELRLWEALERGFLAPFQYFGLYDGTDLSAMSFKRNSGYEINVLSNRYIQDDARIGAILDALNRKVVDIGSMRAIGFCVSIAHANYMAERFNQAGVKAAAVTSDPESADRTKALNGLKSGALNIIFAVDLFNEGIDIPEIDTVIFLRPTDSATIFIQQLGRGLRLSDGKDCLTVLDFVGHQHADFRFDRRFSAITGLGRTRLVHEITEGFPTLPAGCVIDLDRDVRSMVLTNVRNALRLDWKGLVVELRTLGDVSLTDFLAETGVELEQIYRGNRGGWSGLRREAGFVPQADADDTVLGRAFARMLHLDDPERLEFIRGLMLGESAKSPRQQRLLAMLDSSIWGGHVTATGRAERIRRLLANRSRAGELLELMQPLTQRIQRVTPRLDNAYPLRLHARYTRNEALAAYDMEQPATMVAGVRWFSEHAADLFFVTIKKVEAHYSPTTMYHDVALDQEHFQWETQSRTGVGTPAAQRYIHHQSMGTTIHLFIRESKQDEGLGAPPYLYAGPMQYVSHERDRPVRFVWRLDHPLPADVFRYARATAG